MMREFLTLITADACMELLGSANTVLVDCRFDLFAPGWGSSEYRQAHIPGAYYASLDKDLSASRDARSGRHPLPDWCAFADCLSLWGVHPDAQVIAYDQGNGAWAARLWWLLRAVGHERVAVLDGGWSAWLAHAGPVEKASTAPRSRPVSLHAGSGWVTSEQVEMNLRQPVFVLVDARAAARFAGQHEPIDPVAGHIPGALNWPFERNLAADGRFLPVQHLRADWTGWLRGRAPGSVVHMCGSGVTACHNLLAMEHAGLTGSRLYVGSWSEWVQQPGRPVATGAD
jgi:thiosulfate/3-mercaptopyruvate sulfurtransferase